MASKLNPKQEKLAIALASGATLKEAAKKAGYSGSESSACEIAKDPKVSERITELRQKTESALEISRQNFIRTVHARFINEEHPHAPKYAEILAKAQGWNEPEKIDITQNMEVEVYIGGQRVE